MGLNIRCQAMGFTTNTGPVILSPNFKFSYGTGGGCIIDDSFANLTTTMLNIPITVITNNEPLPDTAFDYNPQCLTRDLNQAVASNYTPPRFHLIHVPEVNQK
jgi:hypothetical protein